MKSLTEHTEENPQKVIDENLKKVWGNVKNVEWNSRNAVGFEKCEKKCFIIRESFLLFCFKKGLVKISKKSNFRSSACQYEKGGEE